MKFPPFPKPAAYQPISRAEVPLDVRFDVPRQHQGQMVEVAFGGFDRGEHGDGDPYKRIVDRSARETTFYRLVRP